MERLVSLLGLFVMMILAWLISLNKRKIHVRVILSGVALQFLLALIILRTGPGRAFFDGARALILKALECSDQGARFVFGDGFKEHFFAFSVLPTIIFVSALMSVLFYLGVMQFVIGIMARVMVWVMDVSGSESLCAAAEVFMGHTESPLVVRPYLDTMTKSEIMALMTAGMATIAGGVMAAYAGMGADPGHLLTASIMSAPAALVIAKIVLPETEESLTKGVVRAQVPKTATNLLDAACQGAHVGLHLALNVAAMLIAFIGLIYLVNALLGGLTNWRLLPQVGGETITLQRALGWACAPLAWVMGIEWKDARAVGMLLGEKTILNEFIAYLDLVKMRETISPRSFTIATYALCGFANFGSMAIQIGGIGNLVPARRADFARLCFRAMLGGSLATFMTACIAGVLL